MILKKNITGFTLAELMIAVTVLAIIMTFSASVYSNFFRSINNLKAANLVYEEARFAMERMIKEVRNGTVDYEEYHNQNVNFFGLIKNKTYGKNYCQYSRQFYAAGPDEAFGTIDDVSIGQRNPDVSPAIQPAIQNELYVINIDGNQRSYIRRFDRISGKDTIGKIGLIKLRGNDFGLDHISSATSNCPPDEGERDGRNDTWTCLDGFPCNTKITTINLPDGGICEGGIHEISEDSFVDITPGTLDVVSLQFIINPQDDPRKAYNTPAIQMQPQVTIRLVARATKKITGATSSNRVPDIVLESTVSARVYNPIITECNVKECLPNQQKACPKAVGICGPPALNPNDPPARQSCSQSIWTGCKNADYTSYADATYGMDSNDPFVAPAFPIGNTFYEEGSEITSCATGDPNFDEACKVRRCSDGYDNDCNGLADSDDPSCLLYLCNNGVVDAGEDCRDVGGICDFIRPKVNAENNSALCSDGYDNDCDGEFADEFDANCVLLFCNNGKSDPANNGDFAESVYNPKNYLLDPGASKIGSDLNEVCPDVGGLCSASKPVAVSETGADCFDNVDNDCDGKADELDMDCKIPICTNGQKDCDLVPSDYGIKANENAQILSPYQDLSCSILQVTDNDEQCIDAGGLCGGLLAENTIALCTDGIDNDCDQKFDGDQGGNSDPGCCPDTDNDSFFATGNLCAPKDVNLKPPNGEIDCDNDNGLIFPGANEICNDQIYPLAHPTLGGKGVDSNCSMINQTHAAPGDSWLDRYDPACCIDNDGDGYGDPLAYIFSDSEQCAVSAFEHSLGTESPDCNENDPDIHPGINEEGGLCNDGVDNNCNGKWDHIDTNPGLDGDGTPLYDPACCDFNALEICDDGSDNDCSGKKELADDYCMMKTGRTFLDNFTSTDFKINLEEAGLPAKWEGDGEITIDPASEPLQRAVSKVIPVDELQACNNIGSVTVTPNAVQPAGTHIEYQLSIDGGVTWCGNEDCLGDGGDTLSEGENLINFVALGQNGKSLQWRSNFNGNGIDVPTLNSLRLDFICNE